MSVEWQTKMNIPESETFLSVSEAVRLLGCSRSKVYQYIKEGRLSSHRIGRLLVLLRTEVEQLQAKLTGSAPALAPHWQMDEVESLPALVVRVRIKSEHRETLEERLLAVEAEQLYPFRGSVTRYVIGDSDEIELVVVWRSSEMPDEETWRGDLQVFQQAFADVVDWKTASLSWGTILYHT